jgi:hypothetical protein
MLSIRVSLTILTSGKRRHRRIRLRGGLDADERQLVSRISSGQPTSRAVEGNHFFWRFSGQAPRQTIVNLASHLHGTDAKRQTG